MPFRMWTYDLAREQAPTLDHLRRCLVVTREAGYDALGLYMEHRFAHPAAPWAHGVGCVTPEMIRTLQAEFPDVQIIPFLNLLGHCEGLIYTEEGKRFRESLFEGMQACPSCPEFVQLCERMVDDALEVFDSEIVHLGGDETWQLGQCDRCKARAVTGDEADLKARLFGAHFGPLAERVVKAGRRPAVWGDMFLQHSEALSFVPKRTVIFDWQYFSGCKETSRKFLDAGFEVVGCPALHTYNAAWLHLPQSEENVRSVARDAAELGLFGVCVTTWECALFGAYDTLLPVLRACGRLLADSPDTTPEDFAAELGEWARLMGAELQGAGGIFAFSGHRSVLKCRLLLYANPFLLWMRHGQELSGPVGDRALAIVERAEAVACDEAERGVTLFVRSAIEFARSVEGARRAYADKKPGEALKALAVCRAIFEDLERVARKTRDRIGGSLADVERCKSSKAHVEAVMRRVRDYGDGSLGYLPAFEVLTHPKFVPHDQACWWLINRWGNE